MDLTSLLPEQVRQKLGTVGAGYDTGNSQLKADNADLLVDTLDAKDFKTDLDFTSGLQPTRLDAKEFVIEPLTVLESAIYHVPLKVSQQPARAIFNGSSRVDNGPTDEAGNKLPKLSVVNNSSSIYVLGYAISARRVDQTSAQADLKIEFANSIFEYAVTDKEGKVFIWNHKVDTAIDSTVAALGTSNGAALATFAQAVTSPEGRFYYDGNEGNLNCTIYGTNVAVTIYPVFMTKSVRAAVWDAIVSDTLHTLPSAILNDLFK